MGPVRVAAVQFAVGPDVPANLATCLRMVDRAVAEGARLIVLPEFCNRLSWYADRDDARRHACAIGGPFLTAIAARAAAHGVHVKANVTLAGGDGRVTVSSLLYGPDGALLGRSDKLTLMGAEGDHLDPGTAAGPVIATPHGRLGMYACMEGVTSDVPRDLAVRGAQVLLNSLNSFATDEASLHVPVRAAENHVWVVAANKVGPLLPPALLPAIAERLGVPPDLLDGAGESQIVAPDGTVVAKGPRTGEAVVVADIDPSLADRKTRPDGTDTFAARRPRLYAPIAETPRPRAAPPGDEKVDAAVVRSPKLVRRAAKAGAELIVLPELAFGPDADAGAVVEELAAALHGTTAHAVTSVRAGAAHAAYLVNADGLAGRQPQLHASARHSGWATEYGERLDVFTLPWGRLALVTGDDALYPEVFRLAAIADADAVAVPFTPAQDWETALGLPERAAENRLNVVASGPRDGLILALPTDFSLWTSWQGPFEGRISHPLVTRATEPLTVAAIHPAQAVNRLVSKNTDLVGGRPAHAVAALADDAPSGALR
ncbi:nitrilase-related carbon-nitrogen hydrolase [Actinomadura opuntiae]|uniref:nitrilase-related carbon-nitrogen hydrolase n=1 Tax=Actinomadura sp. OS1-43 TaxID=604315 RepID=UPI00255B0A50|nr:nitrilase-related carbon-nitrogen hydrolase [Actinomadura sp. OS1-43]MDL4813256.1 nitrilase-related carbon-nitrogen hydrolase [Actinomadura sp. OS1-43]